VGVTVQSGPWNVIILVHNWRPMLSEKAFYSTEHVTNKLLPIDITLHCVCELYRVDIYKCFCLHF